MQYRARATQKQLQTPKINSAYFYISIKNYIFARNFKSTCFIYTYKYTTIVMTKAEIVNDISKKTGIDKATVLTTVEAFMNSVKGSIENGENVYLRGFGSFILKKRAKKTARNISKNTTIIIPEHNIPAFKPAKTFVNSVKA